jgi:hypothetical protein
MKKIDRLHSLIQTSIPDDSKIAENINYVIENADKLIEVLEKIKRRADEIN